MLSGTWERDKSDDGLGWATLTTHSGEVVYSYDNNWWWVSAADSNTTSHRGLIAGFLTGIGIDQSRAESTADHIVRGRVAGGRSCIGPGSLYLYTFQEDSGTWFTFFEGVLSEGYRSRPAC